MLMLMPLPSVLSSVTHRGVRLDIAVADIAVADIAALEADLRRGRYSAGQFHLIAGNECHRAIKLDLLTSTNAALSHFDGCPPAARLGLRRRGGCGFSHRARGVQ
jgi:hypothetical protein